MGQLISVFEKAQPIAALYHAVVSYEVTQNLEASHKWEMEEAVPYWLKILVTQIKLIPILCEVAHYFDPYQPPLGKGRCRRR